MVKVKVAQIDETNQFLPRMTSKSKPKGVICVRNEGILM